MQKMRVANTQAHSACCVRVRAHTHVCCHEHSMREEFEAAFSALYTQKLEARTPNGIELRGVIWADPVQVQEFRRFPEILLLDATGAGHFCERLCCVVKSFCEAVSDFCSKF